MGNKKKKKHNQGYDQNKLNRIADCLEEYINYFDLFIIKEGFDEKEYKKAIKTIKKAIENLRNGNGDAVFDLNKYDEIMEMLNANES